MDQQLTTPLNRKTRETIQAGDGCYITGTIYTARDAAHKRMIETIAEAISVPVEELTSGSFKLTPEQADKAKKALPFDVTDQTVYYLGPSPAREGQIIGSAGPTTSTRMDRYTPILLDLGLGGMIGKGRRGEDVISAMKRNGCVYFAAAGGAGALLSKCIRSSEVIAYEDLGTEAIRRLYVEELPVIAVIDSKGTDQYDRN